MNNSATANMGIFPTVRSSMAVLLTERKQRSPINRFDKPRNPPNNQQQITRRVTEQQCPQGAVGGESKQTKMTLGPPFFISQAQCLGNHPACYVGMLQRPAARRTSLRGG